MKVISPPLADYVVRYFNVYPRVQLEYVTSFPRAVLVFRPADEALLTIRQQMSGARYFFGYWTDASDLHIIQKELGVSKDTLYTQWDIQADGKNVADINRQLRNKLYEKYPNRPTLQFANGRVQLVP